MFGVTGDKFLIYLFLIVKYSIFSCKFQKFQNKISSLIGMKASLKLIVKLNIILRKKKDKFSKHFRNWGLRLRSLFVKTTWVCHV